MTKSPLERLAPDLWVATRPLRIIVGDVGARMTVIRLPSQELILHSPIALDAPTREAIDALGTVRWIVGPNKVHHLFLGDWAAAYPEATLCAAPGLLEKRSDLPFTLCLPDQKPGDWEGLDTLLFAGTPLLNEVVFHHRPSRSLILTDLAFNRPRGIPDGARLFHRLVGARDRFGPHRMVRFGIREPSAAARSVDQILAWEFERVIVSHGIVLEEGGRARFREAFAFLDRSRSKAAKDAERTASR